MTTVRIKGMILASAVLLLAVPGWTQRGPGWGARGQNGDPCRNWIDSLPEQPLDSAETIGLTYMREEEKLARDVYTRLYDKWWVRIFENISQSEQRHFDALGMLLDRYELADPAAGKAVGVFADPGLQTLYGDLVAKGETSLTAALRVGATIEDLDIRDLDKALAASDNDDLKVVYGNLIRGSQNHLRAFVGQLGALGATYAAQYISAEMLADILAGSNESGKGCSGCGAGRRGAGRGAGTCLLGNSPGATPGLGWRGSR